VIVSSSIIKKRIVGLCALVVLLYNTSPSLITEKECITGALEKNLEIRIYSLERKESDIKRKDAVYYYFPKLNVTVNQPVVSPSNRADSTNVPVTLTQYHPYGGEISIATGDALNTGDSINRPTLYFSQELLKGFLFDRNLIITRNNQKKSVLELKSNIINTLSEIRSLYWKTILKKQTRNLYEEGVKLAQELNAINSKKYDLGMIKEIDYLLSESELLNQKNHLLSAKNTLQTYFESLQYGTGINKTMEYVPDTVIIESFPLLDSSALLARIDKSNLPVRIARLDLKNIEARRKQALNNRLPSLTVDGNMPLNSPDEFYTGITLSYTFGDFSPRYEHRLQELYKKESKISIQDLKNTVRLSLREKVRNIEYLKNFIEQSRKQLEISAKSLDVGKTSYGLGEISAKDLIDITNKYLEAKLAYMESLVAAKIEYIEIYRLTGDYDIQFDSK
jgi:outer membrane protein TolC